MLWPLWFLWCCCCVVTRITTTDMPAEGSKAEDDTQRMWRRKKMMRKKAEEIWTISFIMCCRWMMDARKLRVHLWWYSYVFQRGITLDLMPTVASSKTLGWPWINPSMPSIEGDDSHITMKENVCSTNFYPCNSILMAPLDAQEVVCIPLYANMLTTGNPIQALDFAFKCLQNNFPSTSVSWYSKTSSHRSHRECNFNKKVSQMRNQTLFCMFSLVFFVINPQNGS